MTVCDHPFMSLPMAKMLSTKYDDFEAQVSMVDCFQESAFFLACKRGNLLTAQFLASYGANMHIPNCSGLTPLSATPDVELAMWLVKNGADLEITHSGASAMYYACSQTPVHKWYGKIELLLEACAAVGDDPNAPNSFGSTPMMELCKNGNLPAAKLLHAHGANLFCRNVYLESALYHACVGGHLPMMQWLAEQGAVHAPGQSLVRMLVARNHLKSAHWLVLQGAVSVDRHPDVLPRLKPLLVETLKQHTGFWCLLLGTLRKAKRPRGCPCKLPLLGAELVLSLVADFAGVVRGRELRCAREALALV
jgi:hypothetical protein